MEHVEQLVNQPIGSEAGLAAPARVPRCAAVRAHRPPRASDSSQDPSEDLRARTLSGPSTSMERRFFPFGASRIATWPN